MSHQKPKVLVVDDFAAGRDLSAEYLTYRGYEVETAGDGAQAIEKAREFLPDAILMDLSLPEVDGWEATRRLRADEATKEIKIIALTAHALESEKERAFEAGCNEVVTKPAVPKELEEVVRQQLGLEQAPADRRDEQ